MNLFVFLLFSILTLLLLKIFVVPYFEDIDSSNKSSLLNRVYLSISQSIYFFLRTAVITYSVVIVILVACITFPSLFNIKNVEFFIGSANFFESFVDNWKWYFSIATFSLSFLLLGLLLLFYKDLNKNDKLYYKDTKIISRIFFGLSIAERLSGIREVLAVSATVFFLIGLIGGVAEPLKFSSQVAIANRVHPSNMGLERRYVEQP